MSTLNEIFLIGAIPSPDRAFYEAFWFDYAAVYARAASFFLA